MGPNNIVNNIFYVRNSKITNNLTKLTAITSLTPYSIISNNTFIADEANDINTFIAIGKSHVLITNNSFVARIPSTNGYEASAIFTNNSNDNLTWQTYVDNNYFLNLHYGISGNSPCQVGQMRGIFLTKPVNFSSGNFAGSQLFFVSPNGQSKIFSLTDDGEIQITT
jgi:hypothetical protein